MSSTYHLSDNQGTLKQEVTERPQWLDEQLYPLGWLTRFEQIFPRHCSIVMPGCHHFPQVYDAPGVATAIRRWWDEEIEP